MGLLVLVGVAFAVAQWRTPERRARRLIEERRASEALQVIAEAQPSATMSMLRAAALHRVNRDDDELDAVRRLERGEAALERSLLEGLAEDFGTKETAAVREAIEGLTKDAGLAALQRVAEDGTGRAQWGALRFIDLEHGGQGLDLVRLYTTALEPPDCRVRNLAARRLRELKDPAAIPALQRLKQTPRKQGFFFSDDDCGQEQAAGAIRSIQREAPTVR